MRTKMVADEGMMMMIYSSSPPVQKLPPVWTTLAPALDVHCPCSGDVDIQLLFEYN